MAASKSTFVLKTWHVAALLAAFTALFFSKLLTGGAWLWEDFVEQEIPYRVFAAHCLRDGVFPLWNPYTFCGMPFFAAIQTAVLYPTNLLLSLVISPGSLGVWWIQAFIILHYWIAAFGMFLLARDAFRVSSWGSLLAGIAYAFSGVMVTHMIHQGMIFQFAWFPWVVLLMLRGAEKRRTWPFLLGGVLLGISLLAGHPQITLYSYTGLGIITLALLVREVRGGSAMGAAALAGRAALLAAVGAGIFAVQYIPSQEMADLVVRSDVTYEFASEGSLGWSQLVTAAVPKFFGSTEATPTKLPFWYNEGKQYFIFWETCFYAGVLTLLLAFIGAWKGKGAALRGGLIALAAFAVFYALGDNFLLFPALFQLPLFNKFRDPARIMYLFAFAAAIFAGRGFDMLAEGKATLGDGKKPPIVWFAAGAGFGVLLLLAAGMFDVPEQLLPAVRTQVGMFIGFWIVAVFVAWNLNRSGASTQAAVFACALLALDLFLFGSGINNGARDPKLTFNQRPDVLAKLRAESASSMFRVKMREGRDMLMARNQGLIDRLFLVEGYSPLLLQRHIPLMFSPDAQYDVMNVRYEIAVDSGRRVPGMRERAGAMPRAYLVHHARVLGDSAVMRALKEPFDYRNEVLLEKEPGVALAADSSSAGDARIAAYTPNEIRIACNASQNAVLVLDEIDYPGWEATVDGRSAELLRANSCLRAVALPAGTHEVVFAFHPHSVHTGMMISLVTLVGALVGLSGLWVMGKR